MIAATVLAAGDSVRMGSPKALLELDGVTFLDTVLRKLADAGVDPVYVTVGRDRVKILEDSELGDFQVVENEELSRGPIGSVRSVLRAVSHEVDAILIWPVDIPHVQTKTIKTILAAKTECPIVVPSWRGTRGHPILLKKEIFQEILQLTEAETMKDVVRRDADRVYGVDVRDNAVVQSIDTPEDYATLNAQHSTLNVQE